jgi:hypothetical protein
MVARSGVVFPASMMATLANPMEIYFVSFTVTSSVLTTMTPSGHGTRRNDV